MPRAEWSVVLVAAGLGLFGWAGAAGGQEVADLRTVIRTNADRMLQGPGGDPQATMTNLVGAVSRLAEDGGLPAPFREGVDAAAAHSREGRFLDDRVFTELQAAYRALNGGRAFAVPESAKDMDSILAWGRERIERCLAALQAGRHEESARELMAFIIMVITPVEAP
ncbi:MAG TPA: hypothetical protein VLH75_01000 [Longimicrobiales bacterium]|nr:hypothetical protein [Longimicrobiales bacterium]